MAPILADRARIPRQLQPANRHRETERTDPFVDRALETVPDTEPTNDRRRDIPRLTGCRECQGLDRQRNAGKHRQQAAGPSAADPTDHTPPRTLQRSNTPHPARPSLQPKPPSVGSASARLPRADEVWR